MEERSLEMKVGALLLVAVLAGVGLLWLMGELSFATGPKLQVEFGHTGNVVKGAPVKLGGVSVGHVDEIALTPDHRDPNGEPLPVRMQLTLSRAAADALRQDVSVTVATQGPLGEPYLELYTGSAQAPKRDLSHPVRGVDAPRLDLVAGRLSKFLETASRIFDEDPQALTKLVDGVSSLSQSADAVLRDNREDFHTIASELAVAAKDLRALSQLARRDLEPGGKAAGLLDDAAVSARALSNVTRGLTPEDGVKLRAAIDRYAQAGDSLEKLAERGNRILNSVEMGQGTLGGLAKDPAVYQDLKALVTDLKKHPWKVLWKGD